MPTEHASGAWQPNELRFAPLGGLIAHEMDLARARTPARPLAREGRLRHPRVPGDGEREISVETIRPGKTIELVEAVATIDGRQVVQSSSWYLAEATPRGPCTAARPHRCRPRKACPVHPLTERWPRRVRRRASTPRVIEEALPGRATVWVSSPHDILDGEPVSNHAAFLSLVDAANGVATRVHPDEWVFPNVDLTIHLHRQPTGRWVGARQRP